MLRRFGAIQLEIHSTLIESKILVDYEECLKELVQLIRLIPLIILLLATLNLKLLKDVKSNSCVCELMIILK